MHNRFQSLKLKNVAIWSTSPIKLMASNAHLTFPLKLGEFQKH